MQRFDDPFAYEPPRSTPPQVPTSEVFVDQTPTAPIPRQRPARKGLARGGPWVVVAVVALVLAGLYVWQVGVPANLEDAPARVVGATSGPTGLADAARSCSAGELADDDHTLMLDMMGEDYGSGSETIEDVACVLAALDAPSAVAYRMDGTRALDGMQSATWGAYSATWTYHPDDGLDLIITVAG